MFNTDFLLASLLWGTVGSGFFIYGKKQGAAIPMIGGLTLIALTFFISSSLVLSLVSIGLIGAMIWLIRQGY